MENEYFKINENEKDFYQVSLKLILKNGKNEVLCLKAVDNGTYAGFYDFPGGRINRNEFVLPFDEIIKREASEEIGDVQFEINSELRGLGRHLIFENKKETHVLYIFFEAKYLSGDIKLSEEHTGYRWIDLKNIEPEEYFKSGILEGVKMYLARL